MYKSFVTVSSKADEYVNLTEETRRPFSVLSCLLLASLPFLAVPAPTNIQFSDVGPSSFIVQWRAPDVQLRGYRVLVTPKNSIAPPKDMSISPDSTQVTVPGLLVTIVLPQHLLCICSHSPWKLLPLIQATPMHP